MARRASKSVGWNPRGNHAMWAAVAGFLAAALTGLPLMWIGGTGRPLLAPAENLAAGWGTHLAFGLALGGVYGLLVWTRDAWKGAGLGAAWGLLLGVVFALVLAPAFFPTATLVRPTAPALLVLLVYALWGAIMGMLYALALRTTEQASRAPGRVRRHA